MTTPYRQLRTRRKERRLEPRNVKANTLRGIIDDAQHPSNLVLHSEIPDVDRQIYLFLNGERLFSACSLNHYSRSVCDDSFWAMKARVEFGDSVKGDNKALYTELYPMMPTERFLWACERGYIRMVEYIVSNGVDVHAEYNNALRRGATNGHLEVVEYLMAQGADIHEVNEYAIRRAAEYGHLEVVKYLVAQGADLHAENENAIRWAAEYGHLVVVEYLVAQGANIHAG